MRELLVACALACVKFPLSAAIAAALALLPAQSSKAEDIRCECRFSDSAWKGYGTRAACSAVMTRGKKECNVSFGGTGADPAVIKDLGMDPVAYEQEVHKTIVTYFSLVDSKRDALTDPKFVEKALPMFMRGAYARQGVDNVKQLDRAVVNVVAKNSSEIAAVFSGKKDGPLKFEESNLKFVIFRGVVTVESGSLSLVTVFLPL